MSITAGRLLLGVGALGILCVQPGGWSLGIGPGPSKFPVPHGSAPFFVLCLGLLLHVLPAASRSASAGTLAVGACLYAGGSLLQLFGTALAGLLPLGAFVAAAGAVLCAGSAPGKGPVFVRLLPAVIALGLGLEGLLALNAVGDVEALRKLLGGELEIRQRLLRLARVAAVILPLLAFLVMELRGRCSLKGKAGTLTSWTASALAFGAVGMPLVLILAAFVDPRCKYLLPLPADLTLAGTLTGAWLACRCGSPRERAGWILIAVSMTVGMVMGGYAFEGPLPSPVGAYSASVRTLMRNWHAASILLGIALLLPPNRPAGP